VCVRGAKNKIYNIEIEIEAEIRAEIEQEEESEGINRKKNECENVYTQMV
jgi:hypothetical protein